MTNLLNKLKSAPITIKLCVVIGILVLIVIIGAICFYRSVSGRKLEQKIDKKEILLQDTKKEVEQKTKDLQNNTIEYGKSVKDKSDAIKKIIDDKKPFTPLKYETSKVKDASYDAMRDTLDNAMPNK